MESVHFHLFSALILITLTGVGCEDLTPVNKEEFGLEDSTVTLSYKYPKLSTGDYLFWYRQYPGKPPEFLISHSASGQVFNNPVPGLKVKVEEKQISMNISSAAVSDSAVYYCALQTYSGASKLVFGSGVKLTVKSTDEQPPFYYKVGDDETEICLATGFTRLNATKDQMLNKSLPVRISGDSVFNQVSFLSASDTCGGEETPECSNDWEPDSKVNMTFVIVMGLRLIFLKTIVFNVLMTLRMWLSQ